MERINELFQILMDDNASIADTINSREELIERLKTLNKKVRIKEDSESEEMYRKLLNRVLTLDKINKKQKEKIEGLESDLNFMTKQLQEELNYHGSNTIQNTRLLDKLNKSFTREQTIFISMLCLIIGCTVGFAITSLCLYFA